MIDINEMTVLIVDDMPSMTKSIQNMMKILGIGSEFFVAHSAEDGWNILQEQIIDILFLDFNLPGMNGAELLGMVREDKTMRDMPVVMITAEAYRDYVAESGESEIDAYILKPITIKLLEERIKQVINKHNNPPPMITYLKKARDFEEKGDLDSAISHALMAVEINPDFTRPMRELGYYYYRNHKLDEAEKWLLKAAKKNHLDVFAFHHLGELYLKRENIEKAAHYFGKAMEISPRHLERGVAFGKTLVRMGREPDAIDVFEKAFRLSRGTMGLEEEVANFCMEENANIYAAKLLERIAKNQPNRSDILFKLGVTLEKTGELSKAVSYLQRASELDKDNVNILIHIAKIYLTLKKPMLAERPLKKILRKNPDNELASELLRQCV